MRMSLFRVSIKFVLKHYRINQWLVGVFAMQSVLFRVSTKYLETSFSKIGVRRWSVLNNKELRLDFLLQKQEIPSVGHRCFVAVVICLAQVHRSAGNFKVSFGVTNRCILVISGIDRRIRNVTGAVRELAWFPLANIVIRGIPSCPAHSRLCTSSSMYTFKTGQNVIKYIKIQCFGAMQIVDLVVCYVSLETTNPRGHNFCT